MENQWTAGNFLREMAAEVEALLSKRYPELAAQYRKEGADIPDMGDAEWACRGALLQARDALEFDAFGFEQREEASNVHGE